MTRKLLYGFFGLLAALVPLFSGAQTGFSVVNYTTDNGLPQNTIKDFHFDNTGFLWIATEGGLVRFDGTQFKLFSSPDANTLNNRIVSLNCNAEGRTFVTDINSRVAEIKDGKLLEIDKGHQEQLPNVDYTLGTQLSYPLFQKLNSRHFIHSKNKNDLLGLIPLTGIRYLLLYGQKIELYRDTSLLYSLSYPSAGRYRLFKINNDIIAYGATGGFYRLDPFARKWIQLKDATGFHQPQELQVAWDYQQPFPYIVYKKKVFALKYGGNQISSTLLIDSLVSTSKVTRVEYNADWDLYIIGTENEGFFIYRKLFFKQMIDHDLNKPFYGQYPLSANAVLTNTGDIIGTEGRKVPSFINTFNNYIITDKTKNVYYASGDTVYRYENKTGLTQKLFTSPGSQMFVLDYRQDTLWMINANGIFFHTGDRNYLSLLFPPNQNNLPYAIERISAGKFLYGNCLGLFIYEPANRKTDTLLWIPQKCVRTLWRYQDKIFIGTYGDGWKVWDGKKIISMPLDRNQYLRYAHCFIKDRNNFLWIPTNRGLFKYYLPDVEQFIAGKIDNLYCYHYGKDEGIVNTEFNGGCYPCAVQLQNGYTSLPNLAGLVWFKPEETKHVLPKSPIIMDKLEVNSKEIPISTGPISLPAHVRLFRIELSSPFWGNEINNPIEYRTIDVDTTWKPLRRTSQVIRYTTLPAGHYRIEIRKPQGFGKPFLVQTITFSVAAPWYATTIALIGWILLLILLIFLIIRLRVARYKRQQIILEHLVEQKVSELKVVNRKLEQNVAMLEAYQQELIRRDSDKTRLIRIMSHDLLGPLRSVKMVTDQIEKQKQHLSKDDLLETMSDIQYTAENLLGLCTDLLNWISYQKGDVQLCYDFFDLYPIVEEKINLFRSMAATKNIKLINDCPLAFFIGNDKNVVKVVIHNLLSNAIKFTKAGTVAVSAHRINHHYIISVADSGKGMSNQQVEELLNNPVINSTVDTENRKGHGLGFLIIRELITATQGKLSIQSSEGKGTTITIEWPLKSWEVLETLHSDTPGSQSIKLD